MKKWLIAGIFSVGFALSAVSLQAQAAVEIKPNRLVEQTFAAAERAEVHQLSFQNLYKVFKMMELNPSKPTTKMNKEHTQFIFRIPTKDVTEAEVGTEAYAIEYAAYKELFGEMLQLKITQHGDAYNLAMHTVEGWSKVEGEAKEKMISGLVILNYQLKEGGFFTDTIGHWGESYIQLLYQAGIIQGVSAIKFNPNGHVTRGQLAVMIFRTAKLDLEKVDNKPSSYTDLDGFWGAREIAVLEENGVLDIFTGETFEPNKAVTREEMAYLIKCLLQLAKMDVETLNSTNSFEDIAQMNKRTVDAIGLLQNLNIISSENSHFYPKNPLTRAQFAKILFLTTYLLSEQVRGESD